MIKKQARIGLRVTKEIKDELSLSARRYEEKFHKRCTLSEYALKLITDGLMRERGAKQKKIAKFKSLKFILEKEDD